MDENNQTDGTTSPAEPPPDQGDGGAHEEPPTEEAMKEKAMIQHNEANDGAGAGHLGNQNSPWWVAWLNGGHGHGGHHRGHDHRFGTTERFFLAAEIERFAIQANQTAERFAVLNTLQSEGLQRDIAAGTLETVKQGAKTRELILEEAKEAQALAYLNTRYSTDRITDRMEAQTADAQRRFDLLARGQDVQAALTREQTQALTCQINKRADEVICVIKEQLKDCCDEVRSLLAEVIALIQLIAATLGTSTPGGGPVPSTPPAPLAAMLDRLTHLSDRIEALGARAK